MGMGLEIYNSSGVKTFSSGDYLPRYQGSIFTGYYNGSYTDNNLLDSSGTPFFFYFPVVSPISPFYGSTGWPPIVTLSGATLTWTFDPSTPQGPPGTGGVTNGFILYGVK